VDLINIRVIASAAPESKEGLAEGLRDAQFATRTEGRRQAYFAGKLVDTPVISRSVLRKKIKGPCIVEELDATCILPPGASAELDAHGNILIDAGEP
jgi:N-methylhydantoinase A